MTVTEHEPDCSPSLIVGGGARGPTEADAKSNAGRTATAAFQRQAAHAAILQATMAAMLLDVLSTMVRS